MDLTVIKKPIYNSEYPQNVLATIWTALTGAPSGEIIIKDKNLTVVSTLTGQIYRVTPPTLEIDYWAKSGPDLYTSTILDLDSRVNGDGYIVISWRFDPSAVSAAAIGEYFNIEILLNSADTAATAQANYIMNIYINGVAQ